MELSLQGEKLEFMDAVFSGVVQAEASTEKIVPDAMADVVEVICADVLPLLRSKEAQGGRVVVTATAEVSVVCRFENGSVSALSAEAPLSFACEAAEASRESAVIASVASAEAKVRLINPRKLGISVTASAELTCLEPRTVTLPTEAGEGAEINVCEHRLTLAERAFEKTFSLSEDLSLPGVKPDVGEILTSGVRLTCDEEKAVGSKCVVRGTVTADVVYFPAGGGEPEKFVFTLPYSQVTEACEQAEMKQFEATPALTGVFLTRGSEERRLTLEIHAVLQCRQYAERTVSCVCDAYSTRCELNAVYDTVRLEDRLGTEELNGTVRGTLSVGESVEKIVAVRGECPLRALCADGNVSAGIRVSVLYMSGGALRCASGVLTAEAPCPSPEDVSAAVPVLPGELYAAPSQQGIDVRAPVLFRLLEGRCETLRYLKSASWPDDAEMPAGPSLLLHRVAEGETLWQLGKEGRSTEALISAANGLEKGVCPPVGTLLIIPRKR